MTGKQKMTWSQSCWVDTVTCFESRAKYRSRLEFCGRAVEGLNVQMLLNNVKKKSNLPTCGQYKRRRAQKAMVKTQDTVSQWLRFHS